MSRDSEDGPVDMEYYDIMEVGPDATPEEIRKAYLKLAMKNHPDKGGDAEEFKELSEAYAILSDVEKRELYDTYGRVGMKQEFHDEDDYGEGGFTMDVNDIFFTFMQMFGRNMSVRMDGSSDPFVRVKTHRKVSKCPDCGRYHEYDEYDDEDYDSDYEETDPASFFGFTTKQQMMNQRKFEDLWQTHLTNLESDDHCVRIAALEFFLENCNSKASCAKMAPQVSMLISLVKDSVTAVVFYALPLLRRLQSFGVSLIEGGVLTDLVPLIPSLWSKRNELSHILNLLSELLHCIADDVGTVPQTNAGNLQPIIEANVLKSLVEMLTDHVGHSQLWKPALHILKSVCYDNDPSIAKNIGLDAFLKVLLPRKDEQETREAKKIHTLAGYTMRGLLNAIVQTCGGSGYYFGHRYENKHHDSFVDVREAEHISTYLDEGECHMSVADYFTIPTTTIPSFINDALSLFRPDTPAELRTVGAMIIGLMTKTSNGCEEIDNALLTSNAFEILSKAYPYCRNVPKCDVLMKYSISRIILKEALILSTESGKAVGEFVSYLLLASVDSSTDDQRVVKAMHEAKDLFTVTTSDTDATAKVKTEAYLIFMLHLTPVIMMVVMKNVPSRMFSTFGTDSLLLISNMLELFIDADANTDADADSTPDAHAMITLLKETKAMIENSGLIDGIFKALSRDREMESSTTTLSNRRDCLLSVLATACSCSTQSASDANLKLPVTITIPPSLEVAKVMVDIITPLLSTFSQSAKVKAKSSSPTSTPTPSPSSIRDIAVIISTMVSQESKSLFVHVVPDILSILSDTRKSDAVVIDMNLAAMHALHATYTPQALLAAGSSAFKKMLLMFKEGAGEKSAAIVLASEIISKVIMCIAETETGTENKNRNREADLGVLGFSANDYVVIMKSLLHIIDGGEGEHVVTKAKLALLEYFNALNHPRFHGISSLHKSINNKAYNEVIGHVSKESLHSGNFMLQAWAFRAIAVLKSTYQTVPESLEELDLNLVFGRAATVLNSKDMKVVAVCVDSLCSLSSMIRAAPADNIAPLLLPILTKITAVSATVSASHSVNPSAGGETRKGKRKKGKGKGNTTDSQQAQPQGPSQTFEFQSKLSLVMSYILENQEVTSDLTTFVSSDLRDALSKSFYSGLHRISQKGALAHTNTYSFSFAYYLAKCISLIAAANPSSISLAPYKRLIGHLSTLTQIPTPTHIPIPDTQTDFSNIGQEVTTLDVFDLRGVLFNICIFLLDGKQRAPLIQAGLVVQVTQCVGSVVNSLNDGDADGISLDIENLVRLVSALASDALALPQLVKGGVRASLRKLAAVHPDNETIAEALEKLTVSLNAVDHTVEDREREREKEKERERKSAVVEVVHIAPAPEEGSKSKAAPQAQAQSASAGSSKGLSKGQRKKERLLRRRQEAIEKEIEDKKAQEARDRRTAQNVQNSFEKDTKARQVVTSLLNMGIDPKIAEDAVACTKNDYDWFTAALDLALSYQEQQQERERERSTVRPSSSFVSTQPYAHPEGHRRREPDLNLDFEVVPGSHVDDDVERDQAVDELVAILAGGSGTGLAAHATPPAPAPAPAPAAEANRFAALNEEGDIEMLSDLLSQMNTVNANTNTNANTNSDFVLQNDSDSGYAQQGQQVPQPPQSDFFVAQNAPGMDYSNNNNYNQVPMQMPMPMQMPGHVPAPAPTSAPYAPSVQLDPSMWSTALAAANQSHGQAWEPEPCLFYLQGKCALGDLCPYKH